MKLKWNNTWDGNSTRVIDNWVHMRWCRGFLICLRRRCYVLILSDQSTVQSHPADSWLSVDRVQGTFANQNWGERFKKKKGFKYHNVTESGRREKEQEGDNLYRFMKNKRDLTGLLHDLLQKQVTNNLDLYCSFSVEMAKMAIINEPATLCCSQFILLVL